MKKLPIGIQTFDTIINDDYIYVDKTADIHAMITTGAYYFLSRPRRFGKSLLLSTLHEIFSGNKQLFTELDIAKTDYDWIPYLTIYIDFSVASNATPEELKLSIAWTLEQIAKEYGKDVSSAPTIETKLRLLVTELSEINKVVVLIDEYDYPILTHLHDLRIARQQQEILKSFYTTIKGMTKHIKFILLTGVTKFSKTSVFSGLNNLNDITDSSRYSTLLGYTQDELELYFKDYINHSAQEKNSSTTHLLETLRAWYNGYRFSAKDIKVYNPYSLLLYFSQNQLKNYWFETGTPTFLLELLRHKYKSIDKIVNGTVKVESLGTFNIENVPTIPVLFQTGYLTIKDFTETPLRYTLGFPNQEVKVSFEKHLMALFAQINESDIDNYIYEIRQALEVNDIESFCDQLRSLFANISYQLHIDQEKYYHSLFQFMGKLLGMNFQSESVTDKGRIDVTIIAHKYIYIIECKFNQSAEKALKQIEDKQYYEKYLKKKKKIILVGISFNRKTTNFSIDYVTKEISWHHAI